MARAGELPGVDPADARSGVVAPRSGDGEGAPAAAVSAGGLVSGFAAGAGSGARVIGGDLGAGVGV